VKKLEGFFSKLLDDLSEYLANRKGLLPLIGAGLVILNLILDLVLPHSFFSRTDILLQLGVVAAILGFLLARAL
jgi:hypothetical protein